MKEHYLENELYKLMAEDNSFFDFIRDGSLDGMWYWDLEKPENEWMDDNFWEQLGYDPATKTHSPAEWQDIIFPDDLELAIANFQKHCQNPDHPYDQIVRYRHSNGSTVWIRCRGKAIRDKNGNPIRMLGAHNNITEIMKLKDDVENQLNEIKSLKKQEQLLFQQKKFADMGHLLSAISHQWRQPLNNAFLASQLLRELITKPCITEEMDRLFKIQSDSINFLSQTIEDFSTYFKRDGIQGTFNLTKSILDTVNLLTSQLSYSGIEISMECRCSKGELFWSAEEEHPYCGMNEDIIYGNRGEFQQVMLNILGNAIDAIKELPSDYDGAKRILINIHAKEDSIDVVIFNSGSMIPEEHLGNVFNPYFTTKPEGKGTGIGLYMSKMMLEENMNGKIIAENLDGGVAFTISLPRPGEEPAE